MKLRFQIFLSYTLQFQLLRDIPEVIGIWIAMAGVVAVRLRFVVDLVPSDAVLPSSGHRSTDGEDETTLPSYFQHIKDLEINNTKLIITISLINKNNQNGWKNLLLKITQNTEIDFVETASLLQSF